jgi:hypothetical protein
VKTITFEGCSRAGFYAELGHKIVAPLIDHIVKSFNNKEPLQFRLDFSSSWLNYQERDRVSIYDQIFQEDNEVQLILPYYGVKQDNWTMIPTSDFHCVNAVFKRYFSQSASQVLLKHQLAERYSITPSHTLAVCYRGTDKYREVPLVDVRRYIELVDSIMSTHSDINRIMIQTDQRQVRDRLVDTFKAQAFYIDEMPVTDSSTAIHALIDKSQRVSFAKTLDCSVRIMAECHSLVTSLSNVSWAIGAYRNDSNNVYQFARNGRVVQASVDGQHVRPGRRQLFADMEHWFEGLRAWRRRS